MATQVQIRRGTTAQNNAFLGVMGELAFNTQAIGLRLHDGVTVGGHQVAMLSDVSTRVALSGDTMTGDLDIAAGIHLDTDGTIIAASGAFVISSGGLITFPDNVRQIFNPGADNAGLNVGALAGDPSTPSNGDLWYDSTANELTARINGANVSLGAGGSTPPFIDSTALVMGSADNTKLLRFEVDGFTAATTRVLTVPNANFTLAGLELNNIFTVDQAIGALAQIVLNANGSALFASAAVVIDAAGNLSLNVGNLTVGASAEVVLRSDGSADFASGLLLIDVTGAMTFPDNVRQTFNPGATVAGLNVGSLAGDPSTPINGDLWYDSTGNLLRARINGATVSLGAGGGTPGGADTQVQFNDAGAFGGDAGLAYNKTTDLLTLLKTAIGATAADGHQLINTTAAAAGAQQYSPALRFTGQGWKTAATAASQAVDFRLYNQPVQGSSAPTGNILIDSSINGGAFINIFSLTSGGAIAISSTLQATHVTLSTTGQLRYGTVGSGRSIIASSADGLIELFNTATTGFTRLNFGGVTSSFPAITRSGAAFSFTLADGTGNAAFTSGSHTFAVAALLSITSGTNQRAGNAVLVAGTITVSNTTVTANTIVMLTRKTSGGTLGTAITYTVSAGASFTITSDSALDTSTFSYLLIEVP